MQGSRAPWWLYLIAASFLGYFALEIYTLVRIPEPVGFDADYSSDGSMILRDIYPLGAAARAGLRAGDRIVTAKWHPDAQT